MKTLIGIVLGGALFAGAGFTYDVTRAGVTENVVDVRLVELDGHEYVVASSYAPPKSCPNARTWSYPKSSTSMISTTTMTAGGSSIAILHHVGCKTCCRMAGK